MLVRPEKAAAATAPPDAHPSLFAPPPPATARRTRPTVLPAAAAPAGARPGRPRPPAQAGRRRARRMLPLMGPAFVAAIAYVDPGNFATNIGGGAAFGYTLVWVVVLANVVAMLVQYLSAKTGVATGQDLAELCRDRLPRAGPLGDVGAGGAGRDGDRPRRVRRRRDRAAPAVRACRRWRPAVITAVVAFLLLGLRAHGRRPFELVDHRRCSAVVALAFALRAAARAHPRPADVAAGLRAAASPAPTASCWPAASSAPP